MTTANEKPWRVGRKVGRTIYDATDKLIGVMDTPELAALVTTAVNRYLSRAQPAEQPIGWYQDPNTIVLNSNNPMAGTDIHGMALYVRTQPAEAVDELLLALSVLADEYEALWSVCRSPVDQAADKAQGMDALDAARELLARARGGQAD